MANQKISSMPPATVPLDGTELMEIVQGGVNKKVTTNSVKQTAQYETTNALLGVVTDFVLPGSGDYVYDVDTTAGDVEIDGIVAQRDGQRVTWSNTGANRLKLGVNVGTAANRIRANAGPLLMLQNDSYTIEFCQAISRWLVK